MQYSTTVQVMQYSNSLVILVLMLKSIKVTNLYFVIVHTAQWALKEIKRCPNIKYICLMSKIQWVKIIRRHQFSMNFCNLLFFTDIAQSFWTHCVLYLLLIKTITSVIWSKKHVISQYFTYQFIFSPRFFQYIIEYKLNGSMWDIE